jgi:hypothetical protein
VYFIAEIDRTIQIKISKMERIGVRVFDDQQMAPYHGGFKPVGKDTRIICFSSDGMHPCVHILLARMVSP